MTQRAILFAIAAGLASALLYLLLTTGSPAALMLAYFSQTPLFLVGLGLGLAPAALACGVALAGFVIATQLATAVLSVVALVFFLLSALPVLYIVRQALLSRARTDGGIEWYPPGLILGGLTAYGVAILLLVMIFFSDAVDEASHQYVQLLTQISDETFAPRAEMLARYIPGAVIASALLMLVVNGAVAQGALKRMDKALRPSPEWRAVSLPRWLAPMLAVAVVAAFLPEPVGVGTMGANAAIITGLPFMLAGLAVLHAVSKRWPVRGLVLGLVYVSAIALKEIAIVFVAIGVIDQWLPLRRGHTA